MSELPPGWELGVIGDVLGGASIFSDGDWVESKDQDPKGDVRLIQLADVGDGVFRDRSNRFLTTSRARELRCTVLSRGDVLIARMPDPLGRACLFPGRTAIGHRGGRVHCASRLSRRRFPLADVDDQRPAVPC